MAKNCQNDFSSQFMDMAMGKIWAFDHDIYEFVYYESGSDRIEVGVVHTSAGVSKQNPEYLYHIEEWTLKRIMRSELATLEEERVFMERKKETKREAKESALAGKAGG